MGRHLLANVALPSFLFPLTELDLRPPVLVSLRRMLLGVLAKAAASQQSGRLPRAFFLEKQRQSNWCWASVGVALNRYYAKASLTQCALVQATLRPIGVDCCTSPNHPSCNVTDKMSRVFATIGLTPRDEPAQPEGALKEAEVQRDIRAGCPIVCTMLGNGSAHFVVVVAWYIAGGTTYLTVDDPAAGGRRHLPFDKFSRNFNGRQWAQSTRLARGPL